MAKGDGKWGGRGAGHFLHRMGHGAGRCSWWRAGAVEHHSLPVGAVEQGTVMAPPVPLPMECIGNMRHC